MIRFLHISVLTFGIFVLAGPVRADDSDAKAILDKGIKALGGEEQLAKSAMYSSKSKGTVTFNGADHAIKAQATFQDLDHYRSEFEGEFDGNNVKGVTIINGKKGWRTFGETMELDEDGLANEKRNVYLVVVPATLLPLKGKDFKIEPGGEEKVSDKPAVGIKVTAPDGKDFKLFFDKESGLPVRVEAKVVGFGGEEFTQQTTYFNYKEFDGIKKATKIESKRDGEKFIEQEITEFKVLDKAPPAETFAEPK
jgi:hypothetical protein